MDKVTTRHLFGVASVGICQCTGSDTSLDGDTAGEDLARVSVATNKENLDFVMNNWHAHMRLIGGCAVPSWVAQTVLVSDFPERLPMESSHLASRP